MTPKEGFKVGFMQKCADDGLNPDEVRERIRHSKFMLKSAGWKTLSLLAMLLAPPTMGMYAGKSLAGAQDDAFDPTEAKKREEIAEYQRAVERLQRVYARQTPTAQ